MKKLLSILTVSTMLAAPAAYAAEAKAQSESSVKQTKSGGYETTVKTEKQTPGGTSQTTSTKVDVDVENDGRVSKTSKTEESTDPKGLMNKSMKGSETEFTEKENGGYKQVTTSKRKHNDGTDITMVTTTDVDVDKEGNIVTTAKTEETRDPKGLFNKKTTTSEVKSVNGRVVEQSREVK